MSDEPLSDELQRALAEAAEPPEFPRAHVRRRIEASTAAGALHPGRDRAPGPTVQWAAAAAAALLIFVAGAEYGRRTASPATTPEATAVGAASAAGAGVDAGRGMDPVAVAIQAQGTQYVAELARLSETAGTLSDEELQQARGVAAAILYGAALELLRAAPDDDLAALIVRALQSRRAGDDGPLMWF